MGFQLLLVNFMLTHLILNEMALGHGWEENTVIFQGWPGVHLLLRKCPK